MTGHMWKCECGESFRTLMELDGHAEVCVVEETKDESGFYEASNRADICVRALAGVKDPEAFMRDVRHAYCEDDTASNDSVIRATLAIEEHLKGSEE